jgi:plastocyanin
MGLSRFLVVALIPFVAAQYGNSGASSSSSSAKASPTASASSSAQTVMVGQNGFTFSPDSVVVAQGKSVVFQFYPGDHSVVQGSFDNPCQPANSSGFASGFVNSNSGPASNVFTVTVNDTNPIWFYCGQVGHCQGGMVGVINPPSSGQTLAQYRSAAAGSKSSSSPPGIQGGQLGAASSTTSTGASSTPSGSSANSGLLQLTGGRLLYAIAMAPFVLAL